MLGDGVTLYIYCSKQLCLVTRCKALPRCTVGSRQAEHESQGESMEVDDIAKSRVGNTLVQETNR